MNEIIKQRGMNRDVRMRTEKKWKKGEKKEQVIKRRKCRKCNTHDTHLLVSTCSSFSLQNSALIHLHRMATKRTLLTPRTRLLATIWDLCRRALLRLVAESHLCRRRSCGWKGEEG
jgi:hypothetical protein